MTRTRVAILNVTGYAGAELARLLHAHPHVEIAAVTGRSAAGKRLVDVFPHLWALDLTILDSLSPVPIGDPADWRLAVEGEPIDLIFSALPHAAAAEQLAPYVEAGVPVVDLSADFRLKRVEEYEATYKTIHPAPQLLEDAAYGLPELHRDEIRAMARRPEDVRKTTGRSLVAVPGCHASGVILALAPAVRAGLIEPDVIADTKTGLSGAGRTLGLSMHFSEADQSVAPYGLGGHRHRPEMTQELAALAEAPSPSVTFVPHYIPMTRGILSTCYARLAPHARGRTSSDDLRAVYRDFYADHPFVRVADAPPSTKHVAGTNYAIVHPTISPQGGVVVSSAIDNLGKGAAGAAVQCMNLMLGLPETAGLDALALFP